MGLCDAHIRCKGEIIASISTTPPRRGASTDDAKGAIVLPGIVDLHGDAFERQIMPRPNTIFPSDIAFLDTDRQLVCSGITTAFHGITISWEPGIRSLASAQAIIAVLDRLEHRFGADHRVRWETFGRDAIDAVIDLFGRAKKPVLVFAAPT